jgi:hypothetical protein
VLRHSLAVNLVQKGVSLSEISGMLRHRSQASTLIYAKLDVEGLRFIARPWPVGRCKRTLFPLNWIAIFPYNAASDAT